MFTSTSFSQFPGIEGYQYNRQFLDTHLPCPMLPHCRQYMLQEVHLPLGLVQPNSTDGAAGPGSSSTQLSVGCRVLVLPRGSWLWQPAEVTAVQQAAGASAEDPQQQPPSQHQQQHRQQQDNSSTGASSSSCRYTVQLVGQQRVLTLAAEYIVPAQLAAAQSGEQQEAGTASAAAAATAAAVCGSSHAAEGSGVDQEGGEDSGSDMSFSSEGRSSGANSDDEASSSGDEGVRRLGAPADSSTDVLDHARCVGAAGGTGFAVVFAIIREVLGSLYSKNMLGQGLSVAVQKARRQEPCPLMNAGPQKALR